MWEGSFCAFCMAECGMCAVGCVYGCMCFGVSVHKRPCDGLFKGLCVNGVICVCCCRYRKR